MMRIPDWLIYLVIVILIYANANQSTERLDAPLPPPELGPMLPAESPRDTSVLVELDGPASGLGTAFAVSNTGQWLTARHVVDGCTEVGLNLGGQTVLKVDSRVSNNTDIALLSGKWRRTPLAPDFDSPRQLGEYGYFFGFPQGRPGEVVGELLGRHRLLVRGRYSTEEAVLAWTEVGRTQGLRGSLGGLSGGPVLDKDGEVIGVVAAESPRRGRVYTVAPRNLRGLISEEESAATPIALETYGLQADRFRRDRRITQVICIVQ